VGEGGGGRRGGGRASSKQNLGGFDGVLFNGLSQASGVGQGGHAPPC